MLQMTNGNCSQLSILPRLYCDSTSVHSITMNVFTFKQRLIDMFKILHAFNCNATMRE